MAWLFLAAPAIASWMVAVYFAFNPASAEPPTMAGMVRKAIILAIATAYAGFWPYLLLRRSKKD